MCLVKATGGTHSWLVIKVYGFRLYSGDDKKHGILNLGASPQLECWNTGIMGFGELTEWVIGKIKLTNHKRNEKFGSNPFGRRQIYIIPKLHHSIIPYVEAKSLNLNKYNYFQ
jgi:hypothetical protein